PVARLPLLYALSLVIRRLRRATLFPYTTLFRSQRSSLEQSSEQSSRSARNPRAHNSPITSTTAATASPHRSPAREVIGLLCARGDRKSTRLNSSHVSMSYAVFCL